MGESVVLEFAKMLPAGKPYILYIDNYFTTVPLLLALLSMGIYATGTINIWTALYPPLLLATYKVVKNSARGFFHWVMSLPGIMVLQWNDAAPGAKKKAVSFATTVTGPGSDQTVDRWVRRKPEPAQIAQPNVAKDYSAKMGGVDRNDRGAAVYKISFKTNKWWWAVFWHITDSVIHDAWVLMYPDGAGNDRMKQQLQFRIDLCKQLTGDFTCRKQRLSAVLDASCGHWPVAIPRGPRCACGCNKRPLIGCSGCKVALAICCFPTYEHRDAPVRTSRQ
jgi:hypothetical protein